MSSILLLGDTSGSITVAAPAVAGSGTLTLPTITGTIGTLNSGTAQASTSGTAIDFTNIPAGVRRITIMFNGVSTTGGNNLQVQLGTAGGIVTSGYVGSSTYAGNLAAFSSSYIVCNNVSAALSFYGNIVITNISGNNWVESAIIMNSGISSNGSTSAGSVSLSGALTTVRVLTADAFDAGTINILYE